MRPFAAVLTGYAFILELMLLAGPGAPFRFELLVMNGFMLICAASLLYGKQWGRTPIGMGLFIYLFLGITLLVMRVLTKLGFRSMAGPEAEVSQGAFLPGLAFEQMMLTLPSIVLLLWMRRISVAKESTGGP